MRERLERRFVPARLLFLLEELILDFPLESRVDKFEIGRLNRFPRNDIKEYKMLQTGRKPIFVSLKLLGSVDI